jgi:hypothetical protein
MGGEIHWVGWGHPRASGGRFRRAASSHGGSSTTGLCVNLVLSTATAFALAAIGEDRQDILLVWGVWAVTAGAVQMVGGVTAVDSLSNVAGFAVRGGIFFTFSAWRLGRAR